MKKFVCFILTVCIISSITVNVFSYDAKIFSSEDTEHYYNFLRQLELFPLYNDRDEMFFNDEYSVSRAEVATEIACLLNENNTQSELISEEYIDVPTYHPYAGAIHTVIGMGLMRGRTQGLFEPDADITLAEFTKVLLDAMNYRWKAEISGGFPNGYFNVANMIGLLVGVKGNADTVLNRASFVRIIYNCIDIPIYEINAATDGYIFFNKNEEGTLLTQFHNIYEKEGIVNSNAITSLSYNDPPGDQYVIIGNELVYLNGRTGIAKYFGQKVKYYCKIENDKKRLMYYEPERKNFVATIVKRNFISYKDGSISYSDDEGKQAKIKIDSNADVCFNGKLLTSGIEEKLNMTSGRITLIGNDGDETADVVLINDFFYEKVTSIDNDREVIYCEGAPIRLEDAKKAMITDEASNPIEINDITYNDIIEVSKSSDGKIISITKISNTCQITVSSVDTSNLIIGVSNGDELYISPNCKTLIQEITLGKSYNVCVNQYNEIVYVDTMAASEVSYGYLIKAVENNKGLSSKVEMLILEENGECAQFKIDDTVKINGKKVKEKDVISQLSELKEELNLSSDGKVSQVICYKANGAIIKQIDTASDTQNMLMLKCNSRGKNISFRDLGYNTGVFAGKYAISDSTKIYKVPITNQENEDNDFFSTTSYRNGVFTDGDSYCIESYIIDNEAIVPNIVVWYLKDKDESIDINENLMLVESVTLEKNKYGDKVYMLNGYHKGKKVGYEFYNDSDIEGISRGDIVVTSLNAANKIKLIKKVYDFSSDYLKPEYTDDGINVKRSVKKLKLYNVDENMEFAEFVNEDFEGDVPTDDDLFVVSLKAVKNGSKGLASYDDYHREFLQSLPKYFVTYKNDPAICTKAIIRFSSSYVWDIFFYNK